MSQNKVSPALLLIDVQNGFQDSRWGQRNNPMAEENMAILLRHWRTRGFPVIHVQHLSLESNSPLRREQPGVEFQRMVWPTDGEMVIQKHVNSAFIGTQLEAMLRQNGWTELVIVGLTTDHCVSTTARMAANLGFRAKVVSDATATFNRKGARGEEFPADLVHDVALASLNQEFATIEVTESLLTV